MVLRSITKSVAINRDPADVFRFLADASNWPRWAIVNVLSVAPAGEGWWDVRTPGGPAKLRIRAVEAYGLLDHDFVAPEARWTVPARVVPNAGGTEFLITFFQPPPFTDEFFDQQVALVDKELARLKEILEQPAEPGAAPDPAGHQVVAGFKLP